MASKDMRREITCASLTSLSNCFLVNLFVGFSIIFGLLYTNMRVTLNVEEYPLTWIGSIAAGCFGFASVPVSLLVGSFGCQKTLILGCLCMAVGFVASSQITNLYLLYITLGFLPGFGIVIGYITCVDDIGYNFNKLRPLAIGVGGVSNGLGNLIWPLLTSVLTEQFGWQGCLLIYGGIVLHMIPFALVIKRNPDTSKRRPDGKRKSEKHTFCRVVRDYTEAFKPPGTVLICLSRIFNGAGLFAFATFVPEYAMSSALRLSYPEVSMVVAVSGVGTLFGRVLSSGISTLRRTTTLPLIIVCLIISSVSTVLVLICEDYSSLLVVGFISGLALGGWTCLGPISASDLFENEHFTKGVAMMLGCQGVGTLVGPPLQSYIGTVTGQRQLVFYTAASSYLLSCFLCVLTLIRSKACLKNKTTSQEHESNKQTEIHVISGNRVPDS